ncbi:MAG: sensor histidine kinase [Bdellovibrionota bacterium]
MPRQIALCAFSLVATTAVGWGLHDEFHLTPVLLCLVSSIFLSLVTDIGVTMLSSLASAVTADYFFIGPVGEIDLDFHFVLRAAVFLSTSLLANFLVGMLRRAYVQSIQARLAAEATNREKDEILAILSHDLRAPLTAAQLSVQMIERGLAGKPELADFLRHTARARDACKRVNNLVLDLLDSSKVASSGILPIHRENHDVVPILKTVLNELKVLATQAGVNLESAFCATSLNLYCDSQRISQMVANLVTNALKFTRPGGLVRVSLSHDEPGFASIEVADTGVGMSEQQCSHVFERYWQADRCNRSGVGLGLFIVKAIVDAHGGRISVESTPQRGTKFLVRLPLPAEAAKISDI